MNAADPLLESAIPGLPMIGRGKVRDIYALDDTHLLIVATDRLSAYDVVLPDPIPGKGRVLTQLADFWFAMMADIVPNHLSGRALDTVLDDRTLLQELAGRATVVKRLQPLPVEAVVRGYLIGSGWRDYRETGAVCGIALPAGLEQAARLPRTLFTPATKAAAGDHDENIGFTAMQALVGGALAARVRDISLRIYERAAAYALQRGIIIADTKFEFGLDDAGRLYLIDEVLTPDSSRFWPAADYRPGGSPPSYDKQFVRDYLDTLAWDQSAPGPALPDGILRRTAQKYREALQILTAPAAPEAGRVADPDVQC
ncbi:MAG: phosphoribosylaminoimidazolesuccinocarboxamide synthase [Gammaproteobacteria bacterium]|nr:MAG: phosphoribosylaminoimidazolesuccinocarboxamide synthase [Gammaproteobacteria bacterium]